MLTRFISSLSTSLEPFSNAKLAWIGLCLLGFLTLPFLLTRVVVLRRQRDQARQSAEELREALSSLRESTECRTELLAMASHDLRGASGMARSLADLIARDLDTPSRLSEVATTLVATTGHMEQMVLRLMERAAAEEENWTVTPVHFDLAKLVGQSAVSWRADAARKNITLAERSMDSLPVVLDPMLTAEIINNLVSNAVKFTEAGGRVGLELTSTHEYLKLRVVDNGPGISAKEQHRLFRPFHTLSTRPTAGESSTGLGLAIAKRLTELQQGSLCLERSDATGTAFELTLPRSLANHPPQPLRRRDEAAA